MEEFILLKMNERDFLENFLKMITKFGCYFSVTSAVSHKEFRRNKTRVMCVPPLPPQLFFYELVLISLNIIDYIVLMTAVLQPTSL